MGSMTGFGNGTHGLSETGDLEGVRQVLRSIRGVRGGRQQSFFIFDPGSCHSMG